MSRPIIKIRNAFGVECFAYDLNDSHGCLVFDAHASECGRFVVDPVAYYGLTPGEVDSLVVANDGINLYGEDAQ
jgi:hypothetical protein